MRRSLALSVVGISSLLAAGCALPSKEEWAQIRERGLIPVLIDAKGTTAVASAPPSGVKPSDQRAIRVQAVATPVVVKTLYADPVPSRPGYVFSPHTAPRRVVDVRGYQSGEEVRCPFTAQPFLVPDFKVVARDAAPAPVRRNRPVTEVVSNAPVTDVPDHGLSRLEAPETPPATPAAAPAPSPKPVASAPVPPKEPTMKPAPPSTPSVPNDTAKASVPYGARVPGRPGFVYSPHASRTQLVDVAGTAPGVVVKCPYSNKLFRVPEVASEEIKPENVPHVPGAATPSTASESPAPSPKPQPAPASPSGAPIAPTPAGSLGNPPR